MSAPTYANINGKNNRDVRSACCNSRVSIKLRSVDTTAGEQIVYYCWKCCKLYVVRESDPCCDGSDPSCRTHGIAASNARQNEFYRRAGGREFEREKGDDGREYGDLRDEMEERER